jgi:hypothetical protein
MNQDIFQRATERARISWQKHQNPSRKPDPEDWSFGVLSPRELEAFHTQWDATMTAFKTAQESFVAHAYSFDESLIIKPRFEETIVLGVLGEVRSKLGPLGQSTRLFRDPSEFSWEERRFPAKITEDRTFQESREIAYEMAREVRARVAEAVDNVYRPDSLTLTVGPIARVEENSRRDERPEPFTAILVTAESLITKTVTLAVYAERL